mmetsp:Transcript_838/g.2462  ORF Transcript_838/g.2462 Transcript_838/m.2462 type:complete len:217 (-) Transcript_838:980-1630(-)
MSPRRMIHGVTPKKSGQATARRKSTLSRASKNEAPSNESKIRSGMITCWLTLLAGGMGPALASTTNGLNAEHALAIARSLSVAVPMHDEPIAMSQKNGAIKSPSSISTPKSLWIHTASSIGKTPRALAPAFVKSRSRPRHSGIGSKHSESIAVCMIAYTIGTRARWISTPSPPGRQSMQYCGGTGRKVPNMPRHVGWLIPIRNGIITAMYSAATTA